MAASDEEGDFMDFFGSPERPAAEASLDSELPFASGLFDEAPTAPRGAEPPRIPPRVDEDDAGMEEDRNSVSDGGSEDNDSNQEDRDNDNDNLELEYTPANLAKIFSSTESEFDFLFGPRADDPNDDNASESPAATMQKIVALVSHETFMPQRSEWIGTIVKEIVTLAGSNGSAPYTDLLEERTKNIDSLLSQITQEIDKRKTAATGDDAPEIMKAEVTSSIGILSHLPITLSLKTLAILASTEAVALEVCGGIVNALNQVAIGSLLNSTTVDDLRAFLLSVQSKFAIGSAAWISSTVALLHLALGVGSLEQILSLASSFIALKPNMPVQLPVAKLLHSLTVLANNLHKSFSSTVTADKFSSSSCNQKMDTYNGSVLSERDMGFERNNNWERGSGCAFTSMALPDTPVQYYEIVLSTFPDPPVDMCIGVVKGPTPAPFIPLGGRPNQFVLWSTGVAEGFNTKRQYCAPWEKGDVIGCGYDPGMHQVFFTVNGVYLGPAFTNVPEMGAHPALMMTHRGIKVRTRLQLHHQFFAPGIGVQPARKPRREAVPVVDVQNENVEVRQVGVQLLDRIALVCSAVYTGGRSRSTINEWPLLVSLRSSTFALLRALSKDDALLPSVLDILQLQLFFLGFSGRNTDKTLSPAEVKEWRALLEDLVFTRNVAVDSALVCISSGFDILFSNEQSTLLPRLIASVATVSDANNPRLAFLASVIERSASHSAASPLVENAQSSASGSAALLSLVQYLLDKALKQHCTAVEARRKGENVTPAGFSTEVRMLIALMHATKAKFVPTSNFFAQFATALFRSVPQFFDSVLAYFASAAPAASVVAGLYQILRVSPISLIGLLCGYLAHQTAFAALAQGPDLVEAAFNALRVVDRWNHALYKAAIEVPEHNYVSLQKELLLLCFNTAEATLKRDVAATHIDSLLFSAGFESEWADKDIPATPVTSDGFLQEVMEQRGAGGEFEQKLRRFVLLGSAGSQATAKAVSHPVVDAACRALLAAILKHEDMVGAARFFLADETKSPPERRLQLAYKSAVRIKRSLLMLHQTRVGPEKEYEVLAAEALSRAALVLALQRPQQAPGFAAKRSIRRSSQVRDDTLSPVTELIADFVCGETSAATVQQQLKQRRARGVTRAVALGCVERALKELSCPAFVEFYTSRHLGRALRTNEYQTHLPHYLDQLNGAGSDVGHRVRGVLYDLLGHLQARSTSTCGLCGTLNSFAIKWATESDFQFLSQVGILQGIAAVLNVPAEPRPNVGRSTRKLALRTLELLALSACRGAKKIEDGEELGAAQLHFLQQLADMLFGSINQIINAKQNFTALDGSSLLFNYVIFLDLLSGSPASRLVLTHPRWLPILSQLSKTASVPMQLSVLRILRRVLPQHTVAAPSVAVSTATGGSFKSAISAAFSGAVPKGAAADSSTQNKEKDDAMSVCHELLTLAGRNLTSPGTENPWEQQGIADLAISVLRAVLVQPQWSLPLLTHMCSQLKTMNAAELESPALVEQVASLAVLGGHLLRPRLGQRVDTEKSNKGIITAVRNAKSNVLEVDIRYSPTENTSTRLSTVDVRPDGDGSLADLQLAIARTVPPSLASELLTAIVKLLDGLNEREKATAQSKLHPTHYMLKLQASQALHVLLRQPSTAEAFIGLGCSPTLLVLALDQWKSLEYPPALLVRFATDLELRGIKIKQDEQKPAAPASAKGSLAPTAGQVKAKAPASLTTGGDSKKPAPASPAKAAGAAALKRAALMASTDGSVPASLFDDLDLPASPARVTVPAAAEPPAAQKPVAASAGAAEKPSPKDDKKDNKGKENNKPAAAVPEPPAEVPIVWQVTFAKARYFERASNVVPKHDVPPPSPQNVIKARDALAGYYARQAVICILEAWLSSGRESPSAIASFVQPARLLDLFAAMFNVSTDPATDKELKVLRDLMLHFLRSKVPLPGDKPLDQLMLAAVLHYLGDRSPTGVVHTNISRAGWLLDTLVDAGEASSVWHKIHDERFFNQLVGPFASAHGSDSLLLGTLIAKLLANKTVWREPPPVDLLRPLYGYVHTRFTKEKNKSRKIFTRQLQRLSELLVPLIGKTLVLASPRETLKAQPAAWMTDNKPPNVTGTYSLVPGIAGADFAQDGDGVTFDTKVAVINRVFKCVFRTPLAAGVKGDFHTLLFNSSMDRLIAAHRSAKGVELGMWSNEPATWHGTGILLDKLDEGWHTLALASIKNLSCIYLDGRNVASIPFAPLATISALGNALPSGKEQWGAVAEVQFPSNEVKDPAAVDPSLVSLRQGPLRVGFLQAGISDATLSDRVLSSGSQWATFCGNCVISKGVWSWSVELLTDGPFSLGLAIPETARSSSNRVAFANDKNLMVFESGTGVMWVRGERETGAAKFKRGDVVGFVWKATSNVGSPTLELYVNGRMSVAHDWNNFNASLGVTPIFGMGPNQVLSVDFSAVLGKNSNAHSLDISIAPPKTVSLDNVSAEFRDLANFDLTARAILAGAPLPPFFVLLIAADIANSSLASIEPLSVARYATLMEIVNTIGDSRTYMPSVLGTRATTAIAEHRHGLTLSSLPPAQLQLHYCVLRRLSLLAERALPFIDFSLVSPHSLASVFCQLKPLLYSPIRVRYFRSVVHRLVPKSGNQKEIILDRLRAAKAENDPSVGPEATFFGQGFAQLNVLPVNDLTANNKQTWTCKFKGEGAIDHGGPYRESISRFCSDLQSTYLGLFIKCPNAVHAIGVNREKWIPNPTATSRTQLDMLKFAGKLLGVAIFKNNMLGLDLPSIVWKYLLGEKADRNDLEAIDRFSVQSLKEMLSDNITADIFDSVFPGLNFTTQLSNGEIVELVPRGKDLPVTYENRNEYAALVLERRLNECAVQLEAIREGLGFMVNLDSLRTLTWEELECAVCGNEDFDVEALKRRTNVEFPGGQKAVQIEWLWKALASFTPKQKACFLRFVWGQSRLPASFRTEKMKVILLNKAKPDEAFPESHTCFFEISIPLYSSEKLLREKLLYAITNVTGIDGDGGDLMEDRNAPTPAAAPSLW